MIGRRIYVVNNLEIAESYFSTAKNDEKAAIVLENQKFYNQSAYFFIQAMEKYVKHHIATKIDVLNPYFADEIGKTMGHSLNKSLELLVKIYSGENKVLFEQMSQQIQRHVLKDLNFRFLNSSLRYPVFNQKHKNYTLYTLNRSDCEELKKILETLKNYLNDLSRLK